mmetsp:Transcript_80950/g.188044  ORF Transcript_80950/g.188044 Transcript_80950/m.188044 type:complete len:244 (-) Transcript_80950:1104-1835(-)
MGCVGAVANHGRFLDWLGWLYVVEGGDDNPSVICVQGSRQDESLGLFDLKLQKLKGRDHKAFWHNQRENLSGLIPLRHGILEVVPTRTHDVDVALGEGVSEPRQPNGDVVGRGDVHCGLQVHDQQEGALLLWRQILELRYEEGAVNDTRRLLHGLFEDDLVPDAGNGQLGVVGQQRVGRESKAVPFNDPHHRRHLSVDCPLRWDVEVQGVFQLPPMSILNKISKVQFIPLWLLHIGNGHHDER